METTNGASWASFSSGCTWRSRHSGPWSKTCSSDSAAARAFLKDTGAWVAEKLGRLKLNDTLVTYSLLSRVIELESLTAGAYARVMLWDNLEAISAGSEWLEGVSCASFRQQSLEHVETARRAPPPSSCRSVRRLRPSE